MTPPDSHNAVAPAVDGKKLRRRDALLAEMEHSVPWTSLVTSIVVSSPEDFGGFATETMLRLHLVQAWFGLDDARLIAAVRATPAFRRFARLRIQDLPQQRSLEHFRNFLEARGLKDRLRPYSPSEFDILDRLAGANPNREWRDIPGYEGRYVVSNDGHIGRLTTVTPTCSGGLSTKPTRLLKPTVRYRDDKVFSVSVNLHSEDGSTEGGNVGRFVLIAFKGEKPEHLAHYSDGNPLNSSLSNMVWATASSIALDAPNGGYVPPKRHRHAATATSATPTQSLLRTLPFAGTAASHQPRTHQPAPL